MTELLLFRHAPAHPATKEDEAQHGVEGADARRGLTRKGECRFARFVAELADEGVEVDTVMHSPWLRAVETAELLRPLSRGSTEVVGELAATGADLGGRLELATESGARVALVGHQPCLGELLGRLVGGPPTLVRWRKGGLVWIRRESATALWQICRVSAPRRR